MKRLALILALCLTSANVYAQTQCTRAPVVCDNNYIATPSVFTIAAANPASTCSSQYVTLTINNTNTTITYGTGWCATGGTSCVSNKVAACNSLATQVAKVYGVRSASCIASAYKVVVSFDPNNVTYANLATSTTGCVTVTNPSSGGVVQVGQSILSEGGDGNLTIYKRDGSTKGTLTALTNTATTTVSPTVTTTTIDKAAAGVLSIAPTTATSVAIGKTTAITGDVSITGNLSYTGGLTAGGIWTGTNGETMDNETDNVITFKVGGSATGLRLNINTGLITMKLGDTIANGTAGKFTFTGAGGATNKEDLSIDLETNANTATISSSTGVNSIDLGYGIGIAAGSHVSETSKGATHTITQATQSVTFPGTPGAASEVTSGLIPAGAILEGTSYRVTTAGTNCTSWSAGDGSTADLYAATAAVTLHTTKAMSNAKNTTAYPTFSPGAREVTITANGGNCFGLVVAITATYQTNSAATSD